MNVRAIHHVNLTMPEGGEARARRFWAELLGVPERPKPATMDPRGAWFERGGLRVHVSVEEDFRPAAKAHPAFEVEDLDGLIATLRAAGHEARAARPVDGMRRAFVHDPFGNRVELMQRDASL